MNRVTRNDPLDAWLAAALDARAEDGQPRHDCPLPERIWDAVHLQLSPDERLQVIDHLTECPTCGEAWRLAAELTPADEITAQPQVNASSRVSAMYGGRALLIGAAAVIPVAFGIAFMVFRLVAQPDTASIQPSPTPPTTSTPPTSAQTASPPPAAQQTPNSAPLPPPILLARRAPRAVLPDEVAVRNLIATYENYVGTRDLARLRVIQPGITSVELDALQKEPRAPGSTTSLEVKDVRIDGRTGTATVRLRDTVLIQGERQERTRIHHLTFEKTAAGNWIVVSAIPEEPLSLSVAVPDETAIRRVIEIFKTAIETRNVVLYRSVRPGLSAVEEARLRASFDAIDSQQITITVDDIQIDGTIAIARISRQDVVIMGGERRQSASSHQTLRFEKSASRWIITEIGR